MNNKPIHEIMSDSNYLAHYNHNHDALGRFASSSGSGGSISSAVRTSIKKLSDGSTSLKNRKTDRTPVKKLSRNQKSKQETEKKISELKTVRQRKDAAASVINSGNAKKVMENRDVLTTTQLKNAIDRINTEKQLRQLVVEQNPSTLTKIAKVVTPENVRKVSDLVDSTASLYNNVARIANATRPDADQLPYIGTSKDKKDITSATVDDIFKDTSKYTDKQIGETLKREQNLKKLEEFKSTEFETQSSTTNSKGKTGRAGKRVSELKKDLTFEFEIAPTEKGKKKKRK